MGIVRRRARRRGLAVGMAAGAAMANRGGGDSDEQDVVEAAPAADPTAELTKYASLKDQGVITQEEFDAKKKELLGL